MTVFKVAIGPLYTLVKAPSPEAAALYAGLHIDGTAQLLVRIVEANGVPYTGDPMPWAKYHLPEYRDRFAREVERVRPQFYLCSYVEPTGCPASVAVEADVHLIALPSNGGLLVEVEIRRSDEARRAAS